MADAKAKRIEELMQTFGLPKDQAELAYAIEAGELKGDVIEVDDDSGSADDSDEEE